jgi:diguanylate cyclase (GGDEF)-like protein/PAS domain S-box-containing protein
MDVRCYYIAQGFVIAGFGYSFSRLNSRIQAFVNRSVGLVVSGFGLLITLAHFNLLTYSQGMLHLKGIPMLAGVGLVGIGLVMVMNAWWSANRLCRSPRAVLFGAGCSFVTLIASTFLVAQLPAFWSGPIEGFGLSSLKNLHDVTLIAGLVFGLALCHRVLYSSLLASDRDSQNGALMDSEMRFSALFEQSPSALMVVAKNGEILLTNEACDHLFSAIHKEIAGNNLRTFVHEEYFRPEEVVRFENAFAEVVGGNRQEMTLRLWTQEHGMRHLELFLLPIKLRGAVDAVYVIMRDLSNSVISRYRQRLFERSLDASVNGVLIFEVGTQAFSIVYFNDAFQELVGLDSDELCGDGLTAILGARPDDRDRSRLIGVVESGNDLNEKREIRRQDGSIFWMKLLLSPVLDEDGVLTHYIAIVSDISEQKQQAQQLEYQATHDTLTGLGNRTLFNEVLEREFLMSRRTGEPLAVLFVDLDEFKPINDTMGHNVGDQLLVSVAKRLGAELRPSDTLVRLGGDEFVLMLPRMASHDDVALVAERLLDALVKVHRIEDYELHISASIGVAVLDESISSSEQLLQHADMAMYRAKEKGRNTFCIFTNDLNDRWVRRVNLRNDLQDAIENGNLEISYQPFIAANGDICGFEALSRWNHPKLGAVPPNEFIALAEETGQISELDNWVIERVSKDAQQLMAANPQAQVLAINLSPLQFHRPNFIDQLCKVLDSRQVPYQWIELELTENVLMRDQEGGIEKLEELQSLGFSVAIDDFGTGYSSFAYLRSLPVGKIKIDKTFVQSVAHSGKDAAVCRGIINLAKELGLEIIAEGVETRDQFRLLESWGCRVFQGYYFSRPMPLGCWSGEQYRLSGVS